MKRTSLATALLIVVAVACVQNASLAAFVAWTIDESASSLTLAVPDQKIIVDLTEVTVRVRNQSGGTSWTSGNSAAIDGLLYTNYSEGGSHAVEFLPSPAGTMFGVNSGSYRPNSAAFDGGSQTYTDTTAAAGVFGARVPGVLLAGTFDLAHLAIRDVSYNLTSGSVPVSGTSGGTFAVAGSSFGFLSSTLAFDGLSVLTTQPLADSLAAFTYSATNSAPLGTITDLGGSLRQLSIPISMPFVLTLDGHQVNGTATGQIVAVAAVPEPSTFALLGAAACTLALAAMRRRR